ncbi:Dynein light chain type 1 [Musa troglodytarum]|uniref:Dynein light chain type 1 n=1 Tax=Musa troglodytarum TaxID=320322 RepID=A0A9E7GW71_9LILI|nr:Dynein light chain type 1 [Musa troglodytarum]
MRGAAKKAAVEGASEELERRSQYLSSLIHRTKVKSEADQDKKEVVEAAAKSERREHHHQEPRQRKQKEDVEDKQEEEKKGIKDGDGFDGDPPQEQRQPPNVKVRASDMPLALQKRAFKCARETLASMPRLESKRLACALKKARFFPLYFLFNYLM